MTMVNWTPEMLKRLKAAHKIAVESKTLAFDFDGNQLDVNYAGYLIIYLEEQLK